MSNRQTRGPRSTVTVEGDPIRVINGVVAAIGNTLLATPPVGHRIVVTSFVIQNETAVATTMILREGGLDKWRYLGQNQGDSLSKDFAPGYEWRLGVDATLNYYLDGANPCNYSLAYFTE